MLTFFDLYCIYMYMYIPSLLSPQHDSLAVLREYGLVPDQFDPLRDHGRHMLVRQVRNISLLPPPKVNPPIPAPEVGAFTFTCIHVHVRTYTHEHIIMLCILCV